MVTKHQGGLKLERHLKIEQYDLSTKRHQTEFASPFPIALVIPRHYLMVPWSSLRHYLMVETSRKISVADPVLIHVSGISYSLIQENATLLLFRFVKASFGVIWELRSFM